jgi:O-antigen ligase
MTPTLSVYAYETHVALLRLVCYVLVFLLAYQATRARGRATALAVLLLGIGIFEAAYGIVQYLTGWQYIFFFKKIYYTEEATGTYINRNHFAGLLEMALPFVAAQMLIRSARSRSTVRSRWVEMIASPFSSRFLRDLVLAALMLLALIYSRSRMGIVAGIAGVLVVGAIAVLENPRRRTWLSVALILLVAGIYAWWIGLDPVLRRFGALEQAGALEFDRIPIWRDTLALIRDYPWLGTGLGTYTWSSFHYQTHLLNRRYVHAHNDYLEFAADVGIPLAMLLFASLWILTGMVARKVVHLERTHEKVVAAGCAGAMSALLIHGITDFNLQIPANAYLFSWVAGTAAALVSDS